MMMIILAWKNIWRNKKRSLIIFGATAIGLSAGLFTVGMMTGMYDSMISSGINREVGDLQIHLRAYIHDRLITQSLPAPDTLLRTIQSHAGVRSAAAHTIIEGMASSATTASGIMIFGIDPNGEKEISSVAASVVEGTYFGKPNSILVGKKLADKLKLKLRSRIVLSFAGADGNIVYGAFRITGIFRTESTQFDVMNVFVHRDELSELIGAVAPIHQIVIRTNSSSLVDSVQAALRTTVDSSVIVETWKEIAPELKLTADSSDIVNAVFLGIILFALLFGLTNTLLMSVLDRTRDFGVLLAIGMYRRRLFSMIVLESLLLSFSGGIVGVLFGWIVTGYFNVQGIDLSAVSTGLSAYGIPTMLYPIVKPSTYVILAVMMTATSIVAALYPAIKAVRLKPVQAIRSIT